MISQPVFSMFLCSPLPSGTWWTPGLSIPWCCFPTSSSVCLVFFPLSLCLERWFWPNWWTGDISMPLHFASLYDSQKFFVKSDRLLDLGTDFFVGNMVFVRDAQYLAVAPRPFEHRLTLPQNNNNINNNNNQKVFRFVIFSVVCVKQWIHFWIRSYCSDWMN